MLGHRPVSHALPERREIYSELAGEPAYPWRRLDLPWLSRRRGLDDDQGGAYRVPRPASPTSSAPTRPVTGDGISTTVLIGLDRDQRVALLYPLPRLDVPVHHFPLGDAFTEVRQCERICHYAISWMRRAASTTLRADGRNAFDGL